MKSDKAILLIKKLKKIANPLSNSSENERANAVTRIEELSKKYNIKESESSVIESNCGSSEQTVTLVETWVTILANTISEYFDCQYAEKDKTALVFYGSSNKVTNAGYSFDSVYNQVQELANNYRIDNKRYYGFKNLKSYSKIAKREFKEGLVTGLRNKLKKPDIEGLVIDSELVANSWLNEVGMEVKEVKRKSKELHTRENHFEVGLEKSILLVVPEASLPSISQA
jgi:hypothetical protein